MKISATPLSVAGEMKAAKLEEKFAEMQGANGPFGYEVSVRNNATGNTKVLGFTTSTTFTVDKEAYDTTYFVTDISISY